MNWAEWTPGLAALGAGLVGGAVLAWRTSSGEPLPPVAASEREELERQRDALYDAIRTMELDRGRMDPDLWLVEREKLEVEAAKVLMALDNLKAPDVQKRPTVASRYPQLVGAAWGAAIVLFFVSIYLGLQENTTARSNGGSATGNAQSNGKPGASEEEAISAEEQAALDAAKIKAEASPDNIDAQNQYAHLLIRANKLMDAWQISEKVVGKDSNNVEARTHQGIVLLAINESETAAGLLDKVLTMDPQFIEALVYRGLLYFRSGDPQKAIDTWNKAIAADPTQTDLLQPLMNAARQRLAAGPTETSAPGSSAPIQGIIQVDPSLAATIPPGTTLFVFARRPGASSGMPLAVKRLTTSTFPLSFELGPNDSPMGGGISGTVVLTARIDRDGNPTTHDPNDLEAQSPPIEPGATGVTLTLSEASGATSASAPAGDASGGSIRGTIEGPRIQPGSILFVFARKAGQTAGMPLAVKRLTVDQLPVEFSLGPDDSPMGGGLSGEVSITARIDTDGNPTTHDAADLSGTSAPVQAGATGVKITLATGG